MNVAPSAFLVNLSLLWILLFSLKVSAEEISASEIQSLREAVRQLEGRVRQLEAENAKYAAQKQLAKTKKSGKSGDRSKQRPVAAGNVIPESTQIRSTASSNDTQSQQGHAIAPAYSLDRAASDDYTLGSQKPAEANPFERSVRVGFAMTLQQDTIHDFNSVGLTPAGGFQNWFVTSNIPVVGSAAANRDNRTGFSIQQTHWSVWLNTPTPWGDFEVFSKFNLTGEITGVAPFQVYQAYANWGWLKAGLDYTLFLNVATIPDTLDFEGPNAIPENRPLQLRVKIPLERVSQSLADFYLLLGAEDQPGDITFAAPTFSDLNQIPSIIGGFAFEDARGRSVWLQGLYRHLRGNGNGNGNGNGQSVSFDGWGATLQAYLPTVGSDSLTLGAIGGQALGAYIDDLEGLGLDAAPRSLADPTLKPIPALGVWAAYTVYWNKATRSTASYGYTWADTDFVDPTFQPIPEQGIYKQAHYVSANVIWSPIPPLDVGLEYLFGYRKITSASARFNRTGNYGRNSRLQFTLSWNFGGETRLHW